MNKWKIFYKHHPHFSSEDGAPDKAKRIGVQVIVEKFGDRKIQHSLRDYYGWDGEKWEGSNTVMKNWKFKFDGALIETERFKQIRGDAIAWLDKP